MKRLYASAGAALLGWFVGKALNVPVWRDGWDIGDRTDFTVIAFLTVWYAIGAVRKPVA